MEKLFDDIRKHCSAAVLKNVIQSALRASWATAVLAVLHTASPERAFAADLEVMAESFAESNHLTF